MSGRIKKIIDKMIDDRAKGDTAVAEMTKAKLILKGIYVDKYDNSYEDNPEVIEKLIDIKKQWNKEEMFESDSTLQTAYSEIKLEEEAVLDIQSQISYSGTKVVIYFASPSYNHKRLSRLMQNAFEDCLVFGCTTAGERASEKLLSNSIVALSLGNNLIADAKIEVIQNLNGDFNVKEPFESFGRYFKESPYLMNINKYVGIVLIDGLSLKEEKLLDKIGGITHINFIGGSAGYDLKFEKTTIFANGKAYDNSAVVALLKMQDNASFKIVKTQSFNILEQKLIANKVDEESRRVIEFNHKPATQAYAEALGISPNEDISDYFLSNPVGLVIDENNVLVRSPLKAIDTNIQFFCNILQDMEVSLLESCDMVAQTKNVLDDIVKELGEKFVGCLGFDCIGRRTELEKDDLVDEYNNIFTNIPIVGFYSYGESTIGHMNQTLTMLVFEYDKLDKVTIDENTSCSDKSQRLEKEKRGLEKQVKELKEKLELTTKELQRFNIELEEEFYERSEREKKIRYLSYHDELTDLHNSRYYKLIIDELDKEDNLPISIIMGDINGLKEINDTIGHDKGDELIQKVANSIKAGCRKDDFIARIGGDEFIIILPKTSSKVANIIIKRIEEFNKYESVNNFPVSISFGCDTKEENCDSILKTIRNAEILMYKQKSTIKSRYTYYKG